MEQEHHSHPSHSKPPSSGHHHSPASMEELLDSAKVVAEAAKTAISHRSVTEIDKGRVAEAAENLLDAAKRYGKLQGSEIGDYVDKAEEYLHNLHDSSSAPAVPHPHPHPHPHRRQEHRPARQDDQEDDY